LPEDRVLTSRRVASGSGWRVSDVLCAARRSTRASVEQHGSFSIALVVRGTFRYRTSAGEAMLCPGGVMLGNPGECFECGHDHDAGDRCLAFHLEPALVDEIASELSRVRARFTRPALSPGILNARLTVGAELDRDAGGASAEEHALRIAARALEAMSDASPGAVPPPRRPRAARIAEAVHRIDEGADADLSLETLARDAAMSRFAFLRTFAATVGQTPHQYVLARRLHRAAKRLKEDDAPVARIAADAGFADLSTFNHRFRREIGTTPTAWRAGTPARLSSSRP
jgi:AraC-like DNA-binding protein